MSYSKEQLVKAALAELGMSDYAFDLSPEQLDQGYARLDAMMAEWNARGTRLGYPITSDPSAVSGTTDSGIPDSAYMAVITNLAIQLAPGYGKRVSVETLRVATRGMNTLFAMSARPKAGRLGNMLAGAGAKTTEPFVAAEESDAVAKPEESAQFE